MKTGRQGLLRASSNKKTGIWLAVSLALGFHLLVLLVPIAPQTHLIDDNPAGIELQLVTISPEAVVLPQPTKPELPVPIPESHTQTGSTATDVRLKSPAEPKPVGPETQVVKAAPLQKTRGRDLEDMSALEKRRLTDTLLSRQFITEASVVDQLFGQTTRSVSVPRADFHVPLRQDLVSMLGQPMPELPFTVNEGLVKFSYDPGVKGDLQRFWDVITPEFGWRTKHGTEIRCRLLLVIAGCGWK